MTNPKKFEWMYPRDKGLVCIKVRTFERVVTALTSCGLRPKESEGMDTSSVRQPHGEARTGLRGHAPAEAQAPAPAARRRGQAGAAIRVCLAAATLVMTASTSSTRGRPAAPLAWIAGPCAAHLRLPATLGPGRPQRAALCRMVTRGAPEKGEVRNPWGRAGKPETRIMRQQEAEQVADARAKAWSQALRRVNRPSRVGKQDEPSEKEVSLTEDIKHFHERSGALLRQCGGRMNSLTFNYKWEQRYGESLVTFIARQRLTVAEMLKQSNAFWVVDMPGDQDDHMQIYILNEKNLRQENNRETLGDKVVGSTCLLIRTRAPAVHSPSSACASRVFPRLSR